MNLEAIGAGGARVDDARRPGVCETGHGQGHRIGIRTVDRFAEPAFTQLQRSVFATIEHASPAWADVLASEDRAARAGQDAPVTCAATASAPTATHAHAPICRWGAFDGDQLVGWSCGWMERPATFYMASSGVVASHRRRGIYRALVEAVREGACARGAVALRSQHSVLNNAVLIAKLGMGFHVSGLSQSAQWGSLVELTWHAGEARRALFYQRAVPYTTPP